MRSHIELFLSAGQPLSDPDPDGLLKTETAETFGEEVPVAEPSEEAAETAAETPGDETSSSGLSEGKTVSSGLSEDETAEAPEAEGFSGNSFREETSEIPSEKSNPAESLKEQEADNTGSEEEPSSDVPVTDLPEDSLPGQPSADREITEGTASESGTQPDLSEDTSLESVEQNPGPEAVPEEEPGSLDEVSGQTEEELYALVLEGFRVTDELILIQTGLMAVLFAMFVFRFVYHLISNMVTKYQ